MPNWCSNALIVDGDATEVDDFLAKLKGIDRSSKQGFFDMFVPSSKGDDWYDENIRLWGTKWDVYDIGFIGRNHLVFDTAWSPPFDFVSAVSELYPNCTFELAFSEQGCMFAGAVVIQKGETVSSTEVSVDSTFDEASEDYIPNDAWEEHMNKYSIGMGG